MPIEGKKIVLLVTSLRIGGAELFAIKQANYFSSLGVEVTLISLTAPMQDALSKIEPNVRVLSFDFKASFVVNLFRLQRAISLIDPDIVHAHMIHANLIGRFQKFFCRDSWRLFLTAHSEDEGNLSMLYRFNRVEDAFFHVSPGGLDQSVKKGYCLPQNAFWLPNCTSVVKQIRNSQSEPSPYFLWIGRMEAVKRLDLLVLAFKKFLELRPGIGVRLKLVGDGSEYKKVLELVEHAGLKDKIDLVGFKERPEFYFDNAIATVLVSRREGFPSVLLESVQHRVPVLTTQSFDVPSFKDVIGNGRVVSDDSVVGIASSLCDFVDSLGLCSSHVDVFSSFKIGKAFDCKHVFDGLIRFYD